jgi:hypothetical protein
MMLDPAFERRRILLVDDHGLVRHGIRALLDVCAPELDVDEAGSFEEALQHLESSEYSMLLVDLDLGATKTGLDLLGAEPPPRCGRVAITDRNFEGRYCPPTMTRRTQWRLECCASPSVDRTTTA